MAERERPLTRTLRIKPDLARDAELPLVFANHTIVQQTPNEVVINFFQIPPPWADTQEELDKMEEITGRPIAKIVVTPKHAEEIMRAIGNALGKVVR